MTPVTFVTASERATQVVREPNANDSGHTGPDDSRRRPDRRSPSSPGLPVRFPLGRIVATPGAREALERAGADPVKYIARHATCDWGEVDAEDWAANDRALVDGTRLLSAYRLPDGTTIWVITEADRSATTFLLPSEY